jgi:hypothetical protein
MSDVLFPNLVLMLIKLGTITERNVSFTIGDVEAHVQMLERLLNAQYKTNSVNISNCLAFIVWVIGYADTLLPRRRNEILRSISRRILFFVTTIEHVYYYEQ